MTINALPNYFGLPLDIPLDVRAWVQGLSQNGEVTLRWPQVNNIPEGWILTLEDRATGEEINLLDEKSYTFDLNASDLARRAPLPAYGSLQLPSQLTRIAKKASMRFVLRIDPGDAFPELPRAYALGHNYPNPFNPSTNIQFDLPLEGSVTLEIFDVRGRLVDTLLKHKIFSAGRHAIQWTPNGFASGIYLTRLQIDGKIFSGKMLLLR